MSKVVKFFYSLSDAKSKELLESNAGGGELAFVSGKNQVLPKLEEALLGMREGEHKEISIACADALGEYDEKLVVDVPRSQFDSSAEIEVGMQFQAESAVGPAIVTVKKVSPETITIDANHELAGKDLNFDVEVVDVRDMTEEETAQMKSGCGGDCSCDGGCGGGCSSGCGGDCSCEGGCK